MRAALLLHAGAVLSARHEFGRTCELHDLDERPDDHPDMQVWRNYDFEAVAVAPRAAGTA